MHQIAKGFCTFTLALGLGDEAASSSATSSSRFCVLAASRTVGIDLLGDGQVDIQSNETQLPTRDHSKTYAPKNSLHLFL